VLWQIYRRTQGQHVGFKMFTDDFLRSLARKVGTVAIIIINHCRFVKSARTRAFSVSALDFPSVL